MTLTKDKGKGVASSSQQGQKASKQRRTSTSTSSRGIEEEQDYVHATGDHPRRKEPWKKGPLNKIHLPFQRELFAEKMQDQKDPRDGFLCEKAVSLDQFRSFGIVQKFEDLGWQAALSCYDGEVEKLYHGAVLEWVGSLEYDGGSRPPATMRLIGTVGGVEVVMSMETLNQIAPFDTKPSRGVNRYTFPTSDELYLKPDKNPSWHQMIADLFMDGYDGSMKRDKMKMQARLLLLIVQQNIMPRRSDRGCLRNPDVLIVHSLLTGSPMISFRYLVMMNIWFSRNRVDKKTIPHCRLIQALMKKAGVNFQDEPYITRDYNPFTLEGLGNFGWQYERTERYHKLKNAGVKWRALRLDARPVAVGNEDEDEGESDSSRMRGSDGDDAEMVEVVRPSMPWMAGVPDYYRSHGEYPGMDEFVVQNRPIAWDTWNSYQQAMYDQSARGFEQNRWDNRLTYNRNEHWNRIHAWNQQCEVNLRWQDDQRRRMRDQWRAGEPVIEHPELVDFTTLPPYNQTVDYPVPPVHHSQWIDPVQYAQQQQDQGSSGDAFNFDAMVDTMRSVFGDPQPPYY